MGITSFLNALSLFFLLLGAVFPLHAHEGIVGGQRVLDLKEVPYLVSLSGVCGGSILSRKWVLTAAHCAGYFSEVRGGILNLGEGGIKVGVQRVIKHPDYNRATYSNDFALVELMEEIDAHTTQLKAVELASPDFVSEGNQDPGRDATVYGFGNTAHRQSNTSKNLHKVIVPIVAYEEANLEEAYNGKVDQTMIPAGYANGGKDSCQGDSGGPLVVFDQHNTPVLIGVVSWGEGCAFANKYGIYSKISHAYHWIQKTIASDKL